MSVPLYAASDAVSSALGFALDGLALRQRTIADDIANLDTPHYSARSVDFESALRSAISEGGDAAIRSAIAGSAPSVAATGDPAGANGNNVDLQKETLAAMQSQFQYQMVSRAVTDRFELVRSVVAGA